MEPGGWLLLAVSCGTICALVVFCMRLVLREPLQGGDEAGPRSAPEPD